MVLKEIIGKITILLFVLSIVMPSMLHAEENPTPYDVEDVNDNFNALHDTVNQTSEKLKKMRGEYLKYKKKYKNDPQYQDIFRKLDEANFSGKLRSSYKGLDKLDNAAKKIKDAKDFYDRYKPDQNDPTRSLHQISNLIEDFQKMIPMPEDVKKPMTQLLTFYADAARAYADALKRLDKKLTNFREGTIGTGGRSDVGSNEQIRQYSAQNLSAPIIRSTEVILFPPAEVWVSRETEQNVVIWDGTKWHTFNVGMGAMKDLYKYHIKGMGEPIQTNRMIVQLSNWKSISDRIDEAKGLYGVFVNIIQGKRNSLDQKFILEEAGKLEMLNDLMLYNGDMESFTGAYLYSSQKRQQINSIKNFINSYVGVSGNVYIFENDQKKGVTGATVTSGRASTQTKGGGAFAMIFKGKKGDTVNLSASYKKYNAKTVEVYFQSLFESGYTINLSEGEDDEEMRESLENAAELLGKLNQLHRSFSMYYNYFMRIARHGANVSPGWGGGSGGSFGNQTCLGFSYSFVQAQKKLAGLDYLERALDPLLSKLNTYQQKGSTKGEKFLTRMNQAKQKIFGPRGLKTKFNEMRNKVRQHDCTESHLHSHANGMPDDLRPEFARNLMEGENPATQ